MENCNFEDASVTSISLLQIPSYIGIVSSTFQASNGGPPRSFIDNLDADVADVGAGLNIDMRGCRFINLVGYNSTVNPTASEIVTRRSGAPSTLFFVNGGVGGAADTFIKIQIGGSGGTQAYRVYGTTTFQPTAAVVPGAGLDRSLALYNAVTMSGYNFIGQVQMRCSTLAAGTSVITLATTPSSRVMCFITANTAPTLLQRVVGDTYSNINGVMLYIMFGDANTTIVNNATSGVRFYLKGGIDATPSLGEVFQFMYTSLIPLGGWRQI